MHAFQTLKIEYEHSWCLLNLSFGASPCDYLPGFQQHGGKCRIYLNDIERFVTDIRENRFFQFCTGLEFCPVARGGVGMR